MSLHRRHLLTLPALALAAGCSPAIVRHASAGDVPRFSLGVASGHPRHDTVVLWTRLMGEHLPTQVAVQWELAADEGFRHIVARGTEEAVADWAHSVHAEPAGLQPGREYWYRFTALGQRSTVGRTRTAPAPDAPATLRYIIASCQRFDVGYYAAWRHAAAERPDLIVFLGDYIYESAAMPVPIGIIGRGHMGGHVRTIAGYRQRYAQYKLDADLQAAHAAAPWLMVWDDHEVDNDYATLTAQDGHAQFAQQRAAAYQAYWEHMPFPKAMRPQGVDMRIHGRWHWGRLATFHALDTRQYRDVQVCPRPGRNGSNTVDLAQCPEFLNPQRSLLGAAQERWLAEGWDTQRHWNLLAQQTLMARFSWTSTAGGRGRYWTDGWDGYAPARQRLLSSAAQRNLRNLVVLGGDVHAHYVADLKADFDNPNSATVGAEFCGTSITSLSLPQERVTAALEHNPHMRHGRSDQRGYVSFDLTEKLLHARLMALDDAKHQHSPIQVAARFVVENGRPGAQPG